MWAVITDDERIVAKDFVTKPAALGYLKYQPPHGFKVIDQNSKRFAEIEMRNWRKLREKK